MNLRSGTGRAAMAAVVALLAAACGRPSGTAAPAVRPSSSRGSIEVTARLVEVPEGAVFKRDLYNYATILKYEVVRIHRGEVKAGVIWVGQYNPWKPRREAADERVRDIGGDVRSFQGGAVHRLSLEVPIDDHFMGGIVNKYFGQDTGPLYWAVWTDEE